MKLLSLCCVSLLCLSSASAFAQADEKPSELFAAQEAGSDEADVQESATAGDAVSEGVEEFEEAEPTAEELQQQVRDLSQQMRVAQQQLNQMNGQQGRGPQAIEEIELPENPTREDCIKFIDELAAASQGQNRFSSSDPQVEKLRQIPTEHIDLLVAMSNRSSLRYYSQYALQGVDISSLRDRINDLLRDEPSLIGVIIVRGWCSDAHDAIFEKVSQREPNLGIAWFQAAAEINDPEIYDAIHDCVLQSRYLIQIMPILESMPGYDIDRTVNEVWVRSNAGEHSIGNVAVAQVAVKFGHLDALDVLIEQIEQQSNTNGYRYNSGENTTQPQRLIVLRHIDFSGGPQEIVAWYEANKDDLIFDYLTQRFMLAEDF